MLFIILLLLLLLLFASVNLWQKFSAQDTWQAGKLFNVFAMENSSMELSVIFAIADYKACD